MSKSKSKKMPGIYLALIGILGFITTCILTILVAASDASIYFVKRIPHRFPEVKERVVKTMSGVKWE